MTTNRTAEGKEDPAADNTSIINPNENSVKEVEKRCVLNPFIATVCKKIKKKIAGMKSARIHTHLQNSIVDGPETNILSVLCILIEILSRAHWKRKKTALMN